LKALGATAAAELGRSASGGLSMGVWGPGNFDGDLPHDFLADLVYGWEQLIEALLAGATPQEAAGYQFDLRLDTCEACVMPTVEVMSTVAERLGPDYLPAPETVERWRSHYLSLFDREAGSWGAGSAHEAERRRVIEATFSRLLHIIRLRSSGESIAEPDD
jgi:hypothetical protein